MNKYQQALDNYSENVDYRDYSTKTVDIVNESYDTLQELVDKETPKKVIQFTSEITNSEEAYTFHTCPKCRMLLSNDIYCPKCGQKLDWSIDDE